MTPISTRRLSLHSLALLLLWGLAAPAYAQSQDAAPWLEKLGSVFEQGAFTLEFEGNLQAASIGEGTLEGKITYGDTTRMRALIDITLAPSGAGAESAATMRMLTVQDGESRWDEIDMLGTKQVTRTEIDAGGGLDPVSQLRKASEELPFEVEEIANGKVVLKASVSEADRPDLGQLGSIPGVDTFYLVLDEATGNPIEFRSGGDPPAVLLRFSALERLDQSKLSEGTFQYEPPEGVTVMDLSGGSR